MNKDTKRRATLAKRTLKDHATTLYGMGNTEPFEDVLKDLLADLRHFCDAEGMDFGKLDKTAYDHYSAERAG